MYTKYILYTPPAFDVNFRFLGVKSGEVLLCADLLKEGAGDSQGKGQHAKVKGETLGLAGLLL